MLSRKPWRTEYVLLFCAAQFIGFFAGAIMISALHKFNFNGFENENSFGSILLGTLCFQGITWLLIPVFIRLHEMKWSNAFGLNWKNIFSALFWVPLCFAVILPLTLSLGKLSIMLLENFGIQPEEQEAVKLFSGAMLWPTGIYLIIFAIIIAPVAEEFVFRGVLFPFIKQLGYKKIAWIGVSLLFALIHHNLPTFVPLFVMALALTWIYEKTDCLLASIAVHSLFNATNVIMLILQNK